MAKVVIIDDFHEYVEMGSGPLKRAGHEVLGIITEYGPIDFERIVRFGPQVISVGLYRNKIAYNRPIQNPAEDILGFAPIQQMEAYPAINVVPILLTGNCVEERDFPTEVNYDLFLTFPQNIKLYVPKVEELADTVKSRRRISGYICPTCGSRLTFSNLGRTQDLFCPRDHTTVVLVDEESCIARDANGDNVSCSLGMLMPPPVV